MNRIILIIVFGFSVFSGKLLSQDPKEPKNQIKPALLIIDIQNAYLNAVPEKEKEMALYFINKYIELFRKYGYPIIRVYHYSQEYGPQQGTDQFEFPQSVLIKPDDPKIIKTYPDAFNKTGLNNMIREKGCNTLFLCGYSAVGCVLATLVGAMNNDYKAFMLKSAIMSHDSTYTKNIEEMFDAVGYEVVNLIIASEKAGD